MTVRTKTLGVLMEPEHWRAFRLEAAKRDISASRLAYEILKSATHDFSLFEPNIRKSESRSQMTEQQPA
jgi:hypothetical protein